MDYTNLTDFRVDDLDFAFDVLVCAIVNATPGDLRKAIENCKDIAHDMSGNASKRAIYRDMATLLRRHAKR